MDKYTSCGKMLQKNDDNSIRFRLTERVVDRDGEVIEPKGINLKVFRTNPVVLFQHGWSKLGRMPIGKVNPKSIEQTSEFVDADIIFDMDDEDAAKIAKKVENGFLNAGSIGFRPIKVSEEPVLDRQTGVTFEKSELMEFSIVTFPANTEALAQRGMMKLFGDLGEGKEISNDQIGRLISMLETFKTPEEKEDLIADVQVPEVIDKTWDEVLESLKELREITSR